MSLIEEVRAASVRTSTCGVRRWIEANLDAADRAELEQAFADGSARTSAIFYALERRGLDRRYDALRKHREGRCSCGRTR